MNTQELSDKVGHAYKIVMNLGISEELLRAEAFKYILNVVPETQRSGPANEPYQAAYYEINERLKSIAKALDVDYEIVDLLYGIQDNELIVNLPTKLIPASNTPAMKELAVLLSVGRKHAGYGLGTSFEIIRLVCSDNGKLDTKNFAAAMNALKPNLVTSSKGPKELLPKRPADDLAKQLLIKYNAGKGAM